MKKLIFGLVASLGLTAANAETFYQKLAARAVDDGSEYATTTGDGVYVIKNGGYRTYVFTGNGTFTPKTDFENAKVLVVGGGGSGGGDCGGGGGAGGLVYVNGITLASGSTYDIVVGTGGPERTSKAIGANGNNSSLKLAGSLVVAEAIGGGGGGWWSGTKGTSGGSGGGSCEPNQHTGAVEGQGNIGGAGQNKDTGGGGGGAGAPGADAPMVKQGADGGVGLEYGTAFLGFEQYFAGGGGGGSTSTSSTGVGAGGLGGGGHGAYNTSSKSYTAGEDGLGAGGGGGCGGDGYAGGGAGGKGVVMVCVKVSAQEINSWVTEPALSKNVWPVDDKDTPVLTPGVPLYGQDAMTVKLNGETFSGMLPNVAGDYTLVYEVPEADDWTPLSKELKFVVYDAEHPPPVEATGCEEPYKVGVDDLYVFKSTEGGTIKIPIDKKARILIVGGGGAGRKGYAAGGGNAGQMVEVQEVMLPFGTYAITVGAGGSGGEAPGADSSIVGENYSLIATGGKGGSYIGQDRSAGGSGAGGSGQAWNVNPDNRAGDGGPAKVSDITGEQKAYAGGGGGGAANDSKAGKGGSVEIDGEMVRVGGNGSQGNAGAAVANTGSGGGGGWNGSAGAGGSGIVVIRLSKIEVEISGEISMPDWTEGETASEPMGLTVTPIEAEKNFAYKYYVDADCTEAIQKPSTMGVYYVRGEVAENDVWNPAVSAAVQFRIIPAGGGKEIITAPTITREFTYTGDKLSPVAAGEHYTLSGDTAKTLAGNYMVTLELDDTEKYMWSDTLESDPKVINWTIVQAANKWTVEPGIDKTVWKLEEDPGVVTPPTAQFGEAKAQIARKVNGEYADWTDWDGETMPTEKGKYKIRWQVAELVGGYTALEAGVEFLVDYRYEPTHPFMYQKAGDADWKGADTFSAALSGISGSGYLTGTIELCQDITDATTDKMGKLDYRYITLRSNPDDDQIYVWTRLGKSYNGFLIQNGSKLTLADIVLNITANESNKMIVLFELGVSSNDGGGEAILGAGAVIQGEVSSSLYSTEKGSSFTLNGGTIRNLTAGSSLLPVPRKSFSVNSGTIENCTVNGAIIPLGNNTLNLSNVAITNNTTTAGAITVNYVNELTNGVLKVSGDVIVKGNKAQDDEKNIVLKNTANLQMTGALGANAAVGISFGSEAGDVFGAFKMSEATKEDKATAAKFFWDAKPSKFIGRVNADNELYWFSNVGMLLLFK